MPNLRPHQEEADRIGTDIVSGKWTNKTITAEVIPGGGKTALAILIANRLLDAGVVDDVLWLVPRLTLCDQVQQSWADDRWCNRGGYIVVPCEGNLPLYPSDARGAIVSYQSLQSSSPIYLEHMRRKRTLFILDEVQMLCEDDSGNPSKWAEPIIRAARDLAPYTLAMGGKFIRRKNTQTVPFVSYTEPDASGVRYPKADITYDLRAAISDRSIRPPEFALQDASVTWDEGGDRFEMLLSNAEPESEWNALRTFLKRDETWRVVVDKAIEHWLQWCSDVHKSRIVFVACDQQMARTINDYIRTRWSILAVLAISDEGAAARRDLKNFRRYGKPEAIVTVAMTAIGFDAKDCTHMVYLSSTRSLPWVLQAFARVWRWQSDLPKEIEQKAWIFVPDDPRMLKLVAWFRNQAAIGVRDKLQREAPDTSVTSPAQDNWSPIAALATASRFATHKQEISGALAKEIERVQAIAPRARTIPYEILAEVLQAHDSSSLIPPRDAVAAPTDGLTHVDLRNELRTQSSRLDKLKQVKFSASWQFGDTQRQQPKGWAAAASMPQLQERLDFVNAEIERLRRLPDLNGDSARA